jgi:hypothetical protein
VPTALKMGSSFTQQTQPADARISVFDYLAGNGAF